MRRLNGAAHAPVAVLARVHAPNSAPAPKTSLGDGLASSRPRRALRSTNGRTWRQPTEQWPYQPAVRPWRARIAVKRTTYSASCSGATAVSSTNAKRPARPLARRHQQPQPRLADVDQRRLVAAVSARSVWYGVPGARERRRAWPVPVAEERHEEQRAGIALEPVGQVPVLELRACEGRDRAVDHLHRRRLEREGVVGGRDRLGDRLEVPDGEHRAAAARRADRRLGDATSVPSEPTTNFARSNVVAEPVEPVPAGLPPMLAGTRWRSRRRGRATIARIAARRSARALLGPERGARAVGEHHVEIDHVVDGLP